MREHVFSRNGKKAYLMVIFERLFIVYITEFFSFKWFIDFWITLHDKLHEVQIWRNAQLLHATKREAIPKFSVITRNVREAISSERSVLQNTAGNSHAQGIM